MRAHALRHEIGRAEIPGRCAILLSAATYFSTSSALDLPARMVRCSARFQVPTRLIVSKWLVHERAGHIPAAEVDAMAAVARPRYRAPAPARGAHALRAWR